MSSRPRRTSRGSVSTADANQSNIVQTPKRTPSRPKRKVATPIEVNDSTEVATPIDTPVTPQQVSTTPTLKQEFFAEDEIHSTLNGFTESGELFEVPPTRNTISMLSRINEIPTLITWICIIFTIYIGLPQQYLGYPVLDLFGMKAFPAHSLLYIAIFWRLMYNVFLGLILDYQSRSKGITRFVSNLSKHPESISYQIISHLLYATVGCDSLKEKPAEFNAWVLNTQIVNVILPNDVFAFLLFALREIHIFGYHSELEYASLSIFSWLVQFFPAFKPIFILSENYIYIFHFMIYVAGAILIIGSVYSKMLSHKVIGYYAWFWGDFFFRIDKTLKFDGIFELFPHPMYTVGYAWMYGSSLIAGSYPVLALAMFSHLLQIGFLFYVEEPHIQRTYGLEFEITKKTHNENILIIHNFDIYRSSDIMMLFIVLLYILTTILCGGVLGFEPLVSEYYFVIHALFSTIVGRFIISSMLYKQGKTKFWTNHFVNQKNLSIDEAFNEWKRIQNLLELVMNVSYIMLAWRLYEWPKDFSYIMTHFWYYFCGSMLISMLFGVCYWSASESYSALGDFGWFYGDFFYDVNEQDRQVYIARGIYRYFNHPDILFGKGWLYGIALLCHSKDVISIAILHHVLCFVQLICIEEPHIQKTYQDGIRKLDGVGVVVKKFKQMKTFIKDKGQKLL